MAMYMPQAAAAPRRKAQESSISLWMQPQGINTAIPEKFLSTDDFAEVQNFKLNDFHALETREGLTKVTNDTTESAAAIKTIRYCPIGSTNYVLMVDENYKLYKCTGSEPTLAPGSAVTTLEGATQIIPFNSYAILLDSGYIKYFDGTNVKIAYDYGDGPRSYQYNNTCGTDSDSDAQDLYSGGNTRAGAKVSSSSWTAGYSIPFLSVEVWLSKTGSPTGNVTCKIYNAAGDTLLAEAESSSQFDASTLTTGAQKKTFTFDGTTYADPSTYYIIAVEYSGGGASNYVSVHCSSTGSGGTTYYYDGSWHNVSTSDALLGFKPGVPPQAAFGDVSARRLFVAGDTTNPGYLWYSNTDSVFDWSSTDGGGYVSAVDDDANSFPIGGVIAHFGNLYIFGKQQQPYICKLTGSSPSNYALPPTFQQSYTDHKTLISVVNDIWFASGDSTHTLQGVEVYGDIRTFSAGDPVADTIKSYFDTDAFAGYNPKDGQYLLKLSGYSNTLVFHTKHATQQRGKTHYPVSEYVFTNITPTAFGTWNNTFYVGSSAGYLYKLDSSVVDDDSSSLTYTLKSGILEMPYGTMNAQRYYIQTHSDSPADMRLTFYKDGSSAKFLDHLLQVQDKPVEKPVNFFCNSIQIEIHVVHIGDTLKINGFDLRARKLSRRGG